MGGRGAAGGGGSKKKGKGGGAVKPSDVMTVKFDFQKAADYVVNKRTGKRYYSGGPGQTVYRRFMRNNRGRRDFSGYGYSGKLGPK